jgi:preprotein translocase subunit SecB
MAIEPKSGNGTPPQAPPQGMPQIQVRILGQYVKDLSFENPNVHKLFQSQPENPNLQLEINVEPSQVGPDVYESAITFTAEATAKVGTIYELEMVYAGLFEIKGAPPQALEPMLHVNCPALLFPFLRRLAADLTREGGFPPLLLDPVDFAALYMKKREAAAVSAGGATGGGGILKA